MESAGAGAPGIGVEERVQEHAAMIHHLGTAMDRVVQTMDRWERQGVPPAPPPAQPGPPLLASPSPGPNGIHLALPLEYDGTAARCQGFLLQLDLYLATVHPAPMGRERVSALVTCLSGKALEWANAMWGEGEAALDHFEDFTRSSGETSVAHMFLYVTFPEFSPHSQHKVLVDSGEAGNFIDRSFAHRLGIPIVPVAVPFLVHALDSRPLGSGLGRPPLPWAW